MSTRFLEIMQTALTSPYTRGMERLTLALGPRGPDGTIPVTHYDFDAYERCYGVPPDSPRYLLAPGGTALEPLTVRIWFTRSDASAEEHVDVWIPAAWPAGGGVAIPIPGRAAEITDRLRITRLQPQPPADQTDQDWELTALLGNLAKLLWAAGREFEDLACHGTDVAAQRNVDAAHGASLDLLGLDLGAPRFPPRPYTWDADTLALYHLDEPAAPDGQTATVRDAAGHPAVTQGGVSGRTGRFSRAVEFTEPASSITIADRPEFALASGSSFTVEALVKPDPASTGPGVVIAKRSPLNTTAGTGWALTLGTFQGFDHNLRFSLSDGTQEVDLFADRDLADGTFHHVAGVVDNRPGPPPHTVVLLYVDGVAVARLTPDHLGALTASQPIVIGLGQEATESGLTQAQYVGLVEEVRLSKAPRRTFHPVTGEGDDQYRARLRIFQRWLLPTPDALQDALNKAAVDVAGDDAPFVVDEAAQHPVTGTHQIRVLPQPPAVGESVAADGDQRGTAAQAVGTVADETDFDPAWLCRHTGSSALDFGTDEDRRMMQQSVRQALDELLRRLGTAPGGVLSVVKAYVPDAPDLHRVGRALLLRHNTVDVGEVAVQAHAAGFGWVCRTGADEVEVAQPRADVFRITPLADAGAPQPPDVDEGHDLVLGVDPDPSRFADTQVRWSLTRPGAGAATLQSQGGTATLRALAAGDVSVHVEVTRSGYTRGGTRAVRIGLAQDGLGAGQSIDGGGRRGVTETAAAGGLDEDFSERYLRLRTDDQTGHTGVDYGPDLADRRMQPATEQALDRLLALLATVPGNLVVAKSYDPADPGLHQQGRALLLRHTTLPAAALAARAFAAGFAYVACEDSADAGTAPGIHVAVAAGETISVTGPGELRVGESADVAIEPRTDPVAVCLSDDGGRAYIADSGTHRVASFTVSAAATNAVPRLAPDGSAAVAAFPRVLVFAAGQLFVVHDQSPVVSVLDPVTLATTALITTGPRPITLATDGDRLFVGCAGDSTLRAYDVHSHAQTGGLNLPNVPVSIAVTARNPSLYVLLGQDEFCQVDRVSLEVIGTTVATGVGAASAALTPDGGKLYIACAGDDPERDTGTVRVYRTADNQQSAVIDDFPAHSPPLLLSISADQACVYAATSGSAAGPGHVHVIAPSTDTLLPRPFNPGGTCTALAASPATAAYQPCLLAASATAATLSLADPAPLADTPPRPPRLTAYVHLGTGAGEEPAWSTAPFGRGSVQLASLIRPSDRITALAPGPVLVQAAYVQGDRLLPYQCEVRLRPALEDRSDAVISKDQYDLVLNILNWFHPLGVEVRTERLRAHVAALRADDADLLPSYTFPTYHMSGPYPSPFLRPGKTDGP
ncbi:LamG-like jellyroll fold domain-containing protein [Streptomyces sp. FXJ1.172]|uniref:LamG-like jellyroll fold domain-containing protein n=1 Tax=Streptomyces sp. FXJ1.172 TaxID=710705 RepID=UPI0007CF2D99|nr:LamG-like jellyroll fold domain-containing protein [Streptomyces sp. FXJ1.172]WEO99768.1 hypothetical protein A6P39_040190 [Streptomyces sp. FXJ1.172]